MGMVHSTEVFYGVLVAKDDAEGDEPKAYELWNDFYERFGDTQFVADGVMWWMSGDYDRDDLYLVIHQDGYRSKTIEPGQVRFISPIAPLYVSEAWNSLLHHACDVLKLKPLSACGWFVVPDVG